MKKNLFLLFCVYFFVVQAVIIGVIRQESYMYLLALINLVAIVLISVLYKAFGLSDEDGGKRPAIHAEEREVVTHHHEPISHTKKSTPKGKGVKVIIAIILAIVLYILMMGTGFGFRLIGTSIVALVLMFFVCLFSGSLRHFFRYLGTKILLVILGLGIIIFGYQFSFQSGETPLSLGSYFGNNFSSLVILGGGTSLSGDNYLVTGTGTLLGSGMATGDTSKDVIDLFSGMQTSDVVTGSTETTPTTPASDVSVHMGDMIKYILTSHNVALSEKKDIAFTYVSSDNELYPYFRTAYAKTMIGKNTNPSKLALCETYMVMKGILEQRKVTYTKTTVLQQYWNYAKTNNLLNGCVRGSVLKESNL